MAVIQLDFTARKESVFERVNRIAEERKRAAWAAYVPLSRNAFEDDWLIPALVIICVLGNTGTRSTFGRPQRRATAATVARPTELSATANCFSSTGQGDEDIVVIRLEREDMRESRKCIKCARVLPLDKFERDRRNVSGVSWYCKRCRADLNIKRVA